MKINLKKSMAAFEVLSEKTANLMWYRKNYDENPELWKKEYISAKEKRDEASDEYKETLEVLDAVLNDVQSRCSARTIDADDVIKNLDKIFNEIGIAKKHLNGVSVDVDIHAQAFPSAYEYTPESTQFHAIYKNGAWIVTDISRRETRRPSKAVLVYHTDESRQAIIDRLTVFGL